MDFNDALINDLIDELFKRVPCCVVAIIVPDDKEECTTLVTSTGNRITRLGLAHLAVRHCELLLESDQESSDDKDS